MDLNSSVRVYDSNDLKITESKYCESWQMLDMYYLYSSQPSKEVGTILLLTCYRRRGSLGEIKELTQDHNYQVMGSDTNTCSLPAWS